MPSVKGLHKRLDLLQELMFLLDKNKVNFYMELAGDGPARQEMEEFVRLHYLVDKVKF